MKLAKFGGSSLADKDQCQKVFDIVKKDPEIQVVVVSAPGKQDSDDHKVTDMLYLTHRLSSVGMGAQEIFKIIEDRYLTITESLAPDHLEELKEELAQVKSKILFGAAKDYAASRGEYLMAKVMSWILGFDFIDAKDIIRFQDKGRLDRGETARLVKEAIQPGRRVVVPGFYGAKEDGTILTFPRGGSDITGAILTVALDLDLYENWTDVSGFLAADPRIVDNPVGIRQISYEELHELSYMGAQVLQEEAIAPARRAGIPIRILNTNRPQDPGTLIVSELDRPGRTVTGLAGKKNFSVVNVKRTPDMSSSGFFRRLCSIFEANQCEIEHMPSSVDTVSIFVSDADFQGKKDKILEEIDIMCRPDHIDMSGGLSILAIVGQGMSNRVGTSERTFRALSRAKVNVEMISQGASEMNILIGVKTNRFEDAIRALYQEFFSDLENEEKLAKEEGNEEV